MPTRYNDSLFDLLGFETDGFPIDEDAFAFVRLWSAPAADLGSHLIDFDLVRAFEQDSRRLWHGSCHPKRDCYLDGMRISDFQRDKRLTGILRAACCCLGLYTRPVPYAHQT